VLLHFNSPLEQRHIHFEKISKLSQVDNPRQLAQSLESTQSTTGAYVHACMHAYRHVQELPQANSKHDTDRNDWDYLGYSTRRHLAALMHQRLLRLREGLREDHRRCGVDYFQKTPVKYKKKRLQFMPQLRQLGLANWPAPWRVRLHTKTETGASFQHWHVPRGYSATRHRLLRLLVSTRILVESGPVTP